MKIIAVSREDSPRTYVVEMTGREIANVCGEPWTSGWGNSESINDIKIKVGGTFEMNDFYERARKAIQGYGSIKSHLEALGLIAIEILQSIEPAKKADENDK